MLDMNKVKGFLMAPAETFRASKGDSLGSAFRYYTILLVIWTILAAIVWLVMGYFAFQDIIIRIGNMGVFGSQVAEALTHFGAFVSTFQLFTVYVFFLLSLVGIFFSAFIWHIFALLFGAKKEFSQTIKTTMYASTPFFLLGWIPYIAAIGVIWYLVLLIIGLAEMQDMSMGEAAMAVVVPLLLLLIGAIIWGGVIYTLMMGILGIFT